MEELKLCPFKKKTTFMHRFRDSGRIAVTESSNAQFSQEVFLECSGIKCMSFVEENSSCQILANNEEQCH